MKRLVIIFSILFFSACNVNLFLMNKTINAVDQNQMAYRQSSSDLDEYLVFIHAGGLDQEMWEDQIKFFRRRYNVITYDVRGHGKSLEMLTSRLEIDDLKGILETESIQRINLVGCSLGAIIALDFVLTYPEYVDQLVLVSPGLVGFQEKNSEFLALMGTYVQAIQSGDEQKMVQELKKLNAIGETQRTLKSEIDQYVEGRLTDFVARKAHLRVPQIKEASPLDQLKTISVPTLVLSG
ncbi:MAG: alpha/beta hydrolase, partial [Bacteroidota bacterium]